MYGPWVQVPAGSQIVTPNKVKSHQISCLAFVFQGVMKETPPKIPEIELNYMRQISDEFPKPSIICDKYATSDTKI